MAVLGKTSLAEKWMPRSGVVKVPNLLSVTGHTVQRPSLESATISLKASRAARECANCADGQGHQDPPGADRVLRLPVLGGAAAPPKPSLSPAGPASLVSARLTERGTASGVPWHLLNSRTRAKDGRS